MQLGVDPGRVRREAAGGAGLPAGLLNYYGSGAGVQARLGCNSELILDEFGEKLLEELDYQQEARNIQARAAEHAVGAVSARVEQLL